MIYHFHVADLVKPKYFIVHWMDEGAIVGGDRN